MSCKRRTNHFTAPPAVPRQPMKGDKAGRTQRLCFLLPSCQMKCGKQPNNPERLAGSHSMTGITERKNYQMGTTTRKQHCVQSDANRKEQRSENSLAFLPGRPPNSTGTDPARRTAGMQAVITGSFPGITGHVSPPGRGRRLGQGHNWNSGHIQGGSFSHLPDHEGGN